MAIDPRATTQLTVIITEDANMALDVGYSSMIAGTSQKVAMRPTHVIGQLIAAAFFVLVENYDTIRAELGKVQRTEEKPVSEGEIR